MWAYQTYFGVSLQTTIESICKQIGDDLDPVAFMIGTLKSGDNRKAPVCFEPEAFEYYGEDIFDNLDNLAFAHYRASEDSEMFYTGEGQQERMQQVHLASHRRMVLRELLDRRFPESIHYVNDSHFVHGYDIYIVVRFDREVHNSYVHLTRSSLSDTGRPTIAKSLLQSALNVFFQDAGNGLYLPDAGEDLVGGLRSGKELLRAGAEGFTRSIACRGNVFHKTAGFFGICETLSVSTYENQEIAGSLLVGPHGHEAVEMLLTLSDPFKFSEYRKTIKLLRLTEGDICVVTNGDDVFGLGKIDLEKYKVESEEIMEVNFTGIHQWDIVHNGDRLLRMVHGNPQEVNAVLTVDKIYSDALRIFSAVNRTDCQLLLQLIDAAVATKSGTQLIISEHAEAEAERLKARCFKVVPQKLTSEDLVRFMRIDGGIMIDQCLNLHAYGVLLDGAVMKKGDSARGSRYNSALTYYESYQKIHPTMIFVISDDGMLSFIPNLRPQVDHRKIVEIIGFMRGQEKEDNYDHTAYMAALDWLGNHRFYLREKECKLLNESVEKIKAHRIRAQEMGVSYGIYSPNEDMDDSYYLPGTYQAG